MVGNSLFLLLLLAAGQDVSLTTNTGTEVRGQWVGITDQTIQLAGDRAVPMADLLVMRTGLRAPQSIEPRPQVMLIDGTSLTVSDLETTDAGDVKLQLVGFSDPISVKLKSIRWIRLGGGNAVDEQWQRLVEAETPTDLLVVRRASGAIDQVQGVITGIKSESVVFDMDGQSIEAPRAKLAGLVLKSTTDSPRTKFEVADMQGNVWRCASVKGTDQGALLLETASGIKQTLQIDQIERLSAEGNVVFLAQQPPTSRSYAPEFNLGLAKTLQDAWLASGAKGDRDLLLVGPGRIEYRIPEGFQRLRATVLPDPDVGAGGGCELVVAADGQELARHQVLPTDKDLRITLDVGKARRLSFEILPAAGGSSGDRLLVKEVLLLP